MRSHLLFRVIVGTPNTGRGKLTASAARAALARLLVPGSGFILRRAAPAEYDAARECPEELVDYVFYIPTVGEDHRETGVFGVDWVSGL